MKNEYLDTASSEVVQYRKLYIQYIYFNSIPIYSYYLLSCLHYLFHHHLNHSHYYSLLSSSSSSSFSSSQYSSLFHHRTHTDRRANVSIYSDISNHPRAPKTGNTSMASLETDTKTSAIHPLAVSLPYIDDRDLDGTNDTYVTM